jgi:uncharacterized protein YceK
MKIHQILIALLLAVVLSGCAFSRARLADKSIDMEVTKNGTTNYTVREITTDLKGSAWFSSSQVIENLKATQTDKTQQIGTDHLKQRGATNTAATIREVTDLVREIKAPFSIPKL